jgi:hypothetical protein
LPNYTIIITKYEFRMLLYGVLSNKLFLFKQNKTLLPPFGRRYLTELIMMWLINWLISLGHLYRKGDKSTIEVKFLFQTSKETNIHQTILIFDQVLTTNISNVHLVFMNSISFSFTRTSSSFNAVPKQIAGSWYHVRL